MPVARTWNALTRDNSGIKLEIVRLVFKTTRSSFQLKEFNELLSSGNNEGQPEYSPPPDDRPTLVVEGGPNAGVTVTLTLATRLWAGTPITMSFSTKPWSRVGTR